MIIVFKFVPYILCSTSSLQSFLSAGLVRTLGIFNQKDACPRSQRGSSLKRCKDSMGKSTSGEPPNLAIPKCSTHGIFTSMYPKNKYGAFGIHYLRHFAVHQSHFKNHCRFKSLFGIVAPSRHRNKEVLYLKELIREILKGHDLGLRSFCGKLCNVNTGLINIQFINKRGVQTSGIFLFKWYHPN